MDREPVVVKSSRGGKDPDYIRSKKKERQLNLELKACSYILILILNCTQHCVQGVIIINLAIQGVTCILFDYTGCHNNSFYYIIACINFDYTGCHMYSF